MAGRSKKTPPQATSYEHSDAQIPMRPEAGLQSQFKHRKPPKTYRYDSSLDPALSWDENPAREQGEALIAKIIAAETLEEAKQAASELKQLSKPFLNWTGKAEQPELTVPSLPLFVHERLSTEAIIETLKGHRKERVRRSTMEMFADSEHSITDQLLRAYEFQDDWVNRLILGDSLQVMNSLLEYEGMAGKVQMIYMDPPYGVKFGSNFQPFVRKREVKHSEDVDLTREPEMVKAYRDTWEQGLHSYLSYLKTRLTIARSLLGEQGSIFVQISDQNSHHVRELLDEIFDSNNFVAEIRFVTTSGRASDYLDVVSDHILWFAKSKIHMKYRNLWQSRHAHTLIEQYNMVELDKGEIRRATKDELLGNTELPTNARRFMAGDLSSSGASEIGSKPFVFEGESFFPPPNTHWKTHDSGMHSLVQANRIVRIGKRLRYKRFADDFPLVPLTELWNDTVVSGFAEPKSYAVQTGAKVIQRCLLMTTDPGDLVLDPTCGSGTTAFVAEQWGRRWITCDVSRVPLALARQRLLTATYDYYQLKDPQRGPVGGFEYKRRQNRKGEEVGGIVQRITLGSIANNEPPEEVVLVDRPEVDTGYVRVSGPFVVEAVIPTPMDLDGDGISDAEQPETRAGEDHGNYIERMLVVLRSSPLVKVHGGRTLELDNIRSVTGSTYLNAMSVFKDRPNHSVGIMFGPQHGAVNELLAYHANNDAREAGCMTLLIFGFAFDPLAREYIENLGKKIHGPEAFAVEMTPDINMGDLLKNMRSSQLFSVAGRPDIQLLRSTKLGDDGKPLYRVRVLGLDTIDPETMEHDSQNWQNLPAWFLDTDYNGRAFRVSQAFFPRTKAWDALKKALKADFDESVWSHLASQNSSLFSAGENGKVAVKVIDDRGNELIAVRSIEDALDVGSSADEGEGSE